MIATAMTIDIIGWGAIATALLAIWALVTKVINPIRNMLKKYDTSLTDANSKLAQMDIIIEQHKKEITESKDDREKMRRAVQSVLRFTLYAECMRAAGRGHRSSGAAKDLELVYQSYKEMGLNGLGAKAYHDYLELPDDEERKEKNG